tara:strand:+ start:15274 stop:15444 length:171 start_codon:yes stop_codon:yes gene_type:complete
MQWLIDNWVLTLLFVGMGAMHLFGHGHGGHGGHGKKDKKTKTDDESNPSDNNQIED